MSPLQAHLQRARRYRKDNAWQSAWPLAEIPAVIDALAAGQRAIVALALAVDHNGELSEDFPFSAAPPAPEIKGGSVTIPVEGFSGHKWYRSFSEQIVRNLGESWTDFVQRSRKAAAPLPQQLLADLKTDEEIAIPETGAILCRLTWHSEAEWKQQFGRNLVYLHDGEAGQPEMGEDKRGIRYVFQYPDQQRRSGRTAAGAEYRIEGYAIPEGKNGRRLFDLAEEISARFPDISREVCAFLKTEWEKVLAHEEIDPAIIQFDLTFEDNWEQIKVVAVLDDNHPDNEPLYEYWRVLLQDLLPVRLLNNDG